MIKKIKHSGNGLAHISWRGIIALTAGLVILAVIAAVIYIFWFENRFKNRMYPNAYISGQPFGGLSYEETVEYWLDRNQPFQNATFTLKYEDRAATLSGTQLDIGYDATLSATQAYFIGRSGNIISDLFYRYYPQRIDIKPFFRYRTSLLQETLTDFAQSIDRQPVNALFNFEDGRVVAFKPSTPGQRLDRQLALSEFNNQINLIDSRNGNQAQIGLKVVTVEPEISTDKVNNLGIRQLIATGYSEFTGSIAGRIHNVILAASKFNGVLIAPGETLSFNDTLGDVSAATGYQSAYIIKDGRTVLGDGGGVCQVSTTLFRAALNAGLPIGERHPHAYRVHYYEEGGYKPGIDATVYSPSPDLKIQNNTPGHILIQTKADRNNLSLTFEFYGTDDGRVAEIYDHQVYDITPPPPPLYQDDPTLKKDVVKQVDWAAWGAKANFKYKVTRNGEVLEDTNFFSLYRPWQAVYLRGTME